jgi:hypothetical protein
MQVQSFSVHFLDIVKLAGLCNFFKQWNEVEFQKFLTGINCKQKAQSVTLTEVILLRETMSSCSHRVDVFGTGITLSGLSDVSQSGARPSQLQLCPVLGCSVSSYLNTSVLCIYVEG